MTTGWGNAGRIRTIAALVVPYLVLMAIVVGLAWRGRSWALQEFGTPAAQQRWQKWRDDVRHHRDPQAATVDRRVPKSAEPPALVLMRDYFAVCLVAAVGFSSLLYAVLAWFLVGAWRRP